MSGRRDRLGSLVGLHERQHVYLTADAVEVDFVDGYDVTRRRVFLNDVALITLHHERRWWLAVSWWAVGLAISIPPGIAVGLMVVNDGGNLGAVLAVAAIFGLPVLTCLVLGTLVAVRLTPVLSVFGRRTKASMRFTWRRRRALEVRDRLVAAVTTAQATPPT